MRSRMPDLKRRNQRRSPSKNVILRYSISASFCLRVNLRSLTGAPVRRRTSISESPFRIASSTEVGVTLSAKLRCMNVT